MEILSAGTSGTSAEHFFTRLRDAGATAIIDTRLHRSSQLAGFAKERDLAFFAPLLSSTSYIVERELAPGEAELKAYRSKSIRWLDYERAYLDLLVSRNVVATLDFSAWGDRPVLLCSEPEPAHCHRRVAAEFLARKLSGPLAVSAIVHL